MKTINRIRAINAKLRTPPQVQRAQLAQLGLGAVVRLLGSKTYIMHTKEELEPIIYALTLRDRPDKRSKWLTRGFRITNSKPGFLLSYWDCRLQKKNPDDLEVYRYTLAKYKRHLEFENMNPAPTVQAIPVRPTGKQMVESATKAVANWAKSGMQMADAVHVQERKAICFGCEFWDSEALKGTGRCKKCGCSTWAKIRLATESCPIGMWKSVAK